ncbi:MAG: hypothetical protein VX619_09265 [bacterium]|nr:hypothetical protein [bacterium]
MIAFILHLVIISFAQLTVLAVEFVPHHFKHLTELEDAASLLAGPNNLTFSSYQTPPIYSIDNHLASIDDCSMVPLDIVSKASYKIKFRCEDLMSYLATSNHLYLSGNVLGRLKGSFLLVSSQNIDNSLYLRWDITTKDYSKNDSLITKWAHEQRLQGKYVFEIFFL